MTHPKKVLLVHFKSLLPFDEAMAKARERSDDFRALEGLLQKYYLRDPATGEMGGLYLWDSQESLDEYSASELRATIAEAYQAASPPQIHAFDVVMPLRTDRD